MSGQMWERTAEAEFSVDAWEEAEVEDAGGTRICRVRVGKTFTGALAGTSSAELITGIAEKGGRVYRAVERFTGELDGRAGTFVMEHGAAGLGGDDGVVHGTVLDASGTEGLAGLAGELEISIDGAGTHHLVLRYRLG